MILWPYQTFQLEAHALWNPVDHDLSHFHWDNGIDVLHLEENVVFKRAALSICPPGHPDRPSLLHSLALSLSTRFHKQGAMADLEESVALERAALEVCPPGHPNRSSLLHSLALSFGTRFYEQDIMADLEESVALGKAALELCPPGHPDRSSLLYSLALSYSTRFDKQAVAADVEESVAVGRAALETTPPGNLRHSLYLTTLGTCVWKRFKDRRLFADLDEAIRLHRAALELRPSGHPARVFSLHQLASCLQETYESQGSVSDLNEAITLHRAALELCPLDHPNRASSLHQLASCLQERFRLQGALSDTDEANLVRRTELDYIPPGNSPQLLWLQAPATSLRYRFRQESPAFSIAGGNHSRPLCLQAPVRSFRFKFRQESSASSLDEAINLHRAVLESRPFGHPEHASLLHMLASCLWDRFQWEGAISDLDEAIILEHSALELCPPGHPDRAASLRNLEVFLKGRVNSRSPMSSFEQIKASSFCLFSIKQVARDVVFDLLQDLPVRLLNTHTGVLCDRDAQLSHVENSPEYKQLMSLTTPHGPQQIEHIRAVVSTYFQYVTLSHRWVNNEPSLQDVEGKVIFDLEPTDGNIKLQVFCATVRNQGYMWAWSDTCCIGRDECLELEGAIHSMFSWYRRSSLTIVHLADVSDHGGLADSVWFKRGWTLQEILAPHSILFYTERWSLYKDTTCSNHKADHAVLRELESATGIEAHHLIDFNPDMADARSQLRWASTRRTTRPEDIAYSLFGIFNVRLPILYGESAEYALGRLLAEIITTSGNTSVLLWVGLASSSHSCFPANITSYRTAPYSHSSSSDVEVRPVKFNIRRLLALRSARKFHRVLANLPIAKFVSGRLILPCIVYRVEYMEARKTETSATPYIHFIQAVGIEPVEISLSEKLVYTSMKAPQYVLVRPCHTEFLDPSIEKDNIALQRWLMRLERPFTALLLLKLPHGEYKRIASSCNIVAHPKGSLKGEVTTLTIV